VWAWGQNVYGELGNGNNISSNVPVQVNFLTGIIAIAGGQYFSLALKKDGTVWAWGNNMFGNLGNGTYTSSNNPIQVSFLTNIKSISNGGFQVHTFAIKNDNTVWAWGNNDWGQFGNGTTTSSNVPILISSLTDISFISIGNTHSIILKNNGSIWTSGWNLYGQLGNGNNSDSYSLLQPTHLCTPLITTVEEIKEPFNISVFPNPFSSQTNIAFKEEQRNTTIRIADVSGKEIKTINFTGRQLVIDKAEMKAGIYFMQVTDEDKNTCSKKIILQ
jgi:alpha-tubulin suppressor-like RCC1 family protein